MIRVPDGYGLTDADDAAVTSLREGCELHRLTSGEGDPVVTVCGLSRGRLVQPFPSLSYAALMAGSLCRRCFPRLGGWSRMLALADFNIARRSWPHMNSSARYAGTPLDERSRP